SPPEAGAQVRILPGAHRLTRANAVSGAIPPGTWDVPWDGWRYGCSMAPRKRHRGHIETLPSGSYRAVVYAGTDPLTHRPRYLRETAKDYSLAQAALTRLQHQVDEDMPPKSAITVGQAIAQWLEVAKLEDTTRERYEDLIRLYITPTFGSLPAAKLD